MNVTPINENPKRCFCKTHMSTMWELTKALPPVTSLQTIVYPTSFNAEALDACTHRLVIVVPPNALAQCFVEWALWRRTDTNVVVLVNTAAALDEKLTLCRHRDGNGVTVRVPETSYGWTSTSNADATDVVRDIDNAIANAVSPLALDLCVLAGDIFSRVMQPKWKFGPEFTALMPDLYDDIYQELRGTTLFVAYVIFVTLTQELGDTVRAITVYVDDDNKDCVTNYQIEIECARTTQNSIWVYGASCYDTEPLNPTSILVEDVQTSELNTVPDIKNCIYRSRRS